jgi:hypothetical protein
VDERAVVLGDGLEQRGGQVDVELASDAELGPDGALLWGVVPYLDAE